MIKEIKYNGYSANPSDYECVDGDLATTIGLLQEDGALKPVPPPAVVLQLSGDESVKYIHKTASFEHYIVYNSAGSSTYAYFINRETGVRGELDLSYKTTHFNAIGNTLLAFTENGIYYFLWKNGSYNALGNHIPDVEVSFGLVGYPRLYSRSDESHKVFEISFDEIAEEDLYNELSENNKNRITEQVMAKVNKFVAQETVNNGRFCFPFFVRYALRLYDGSLVYHSAPILMNPSTSAAPVVLWRRALGDSDSYTSAKCDIMLVAASLDYRVIRNSDSFFLEDWSDIVKSIEVFISKPIYTYNQDGKITSFADADNYTTKFIGRLYASNASPATRAAGDAIPIGPPKPEDELTGDFTSKEFLNYYCEWDYSRIYSMYYSSDRTYPSTTFHLPEFTDGKVKETLQNTSTFYKLCSIDMADALSDDRKDIVVDNEYLQSLVTREVMTDDYLSHDQLQAKHSFVYNSRINLAGLRRKPFSGFLAQAMFAYCNCRYGLALNGTEMDITMYTNDTDSYSVRVYIKENGEDYVVESSAPSRDLSPLVPFCSYEVTYGDGITGMSRHSWGSYMFYPNPNAYKMVILNNSSPCYEVDLRPHEFLNGAYAILDYEQARELNVTGLPLIPPSSAAFPVEVSNKIYTSEVNNPFYFPLLGINTVGTGDILGISSAAKALSEGQFGQFPLYAFTTEGVWALEVSPTGTYSAKQSITRDVVIAPDSITQIDSAVLFATNRGIMLLSGSSVQCISDILNSENPFSLAELPKSQALITIFNSKAAESEQTNIDNVTLLPFSNFLAGCRMVYDYTNQHIIVYNPNVRYAYVYSMKSHTWGMVRSDIVSNVNSYPSALAMADGAKLVDFSKTDASTTTSLVITRPFKMDDADGFKTINTIIQRGMFHPAHVQQVLYGSNDLYNWHTVWSSVDRMLRGFRGTPYKAYRLALVCKLDKSESLYGCTVSYKPRMANQVR